MPAPAVALSPYFRLLACGLEGEVAANLMDLLPECHWTLQSKAPNDAGACRSLFADVKPNIAFLPAEFPDRDVFLSTAREAAVPVVVLSRLPDARDWVSAMDAGASDYVVTPISLRQLHWILQSARVPAIAAAL